jgi:hypothetical protein
MPSVDAALAAALGDGAIERILAAVPDAWLVGDGPGRTAADVRAAYAAYLHRRLEPPRPFLPEAARAH